MIRPVTGPARLRMGNCSGVAPISRNSGFTADWVRPKLNWTPKNPRFIIRRALVVINGLRSSCPGPGGTVSAAVVVVIGTPSADAIQLETWAATPDPPCAVRDHRCRQPGLCPQTFV